MSEVLNHAVAESAIRWLLNNPGIASGVALPAMLGLALYLRARLPRR
jgi:hypothetical protein